MASSNDSSLGCKLTRISVENIPTQAVFWIASLHLMFPGLFYDQSYPVHYCLPRTILVSLSLVKTKGQIIIVYMENLLGSYFHCPKFQLHNHQTSEYVSAYNSQKISSFVVTLLHKTMVCTEESDKKCREGI